MATSEFNTLSQICIKAAAIHPTAGYVRHSRAVEIVTKPIRYSEMNDRRFKVISPPASPWSFHMPLRTGSFPVESRFEFYGNIP